MDKINKYIENQLDFKFKFSIDIFYLSRIKKWIRIKKNELFQRIRI